MKKILFLLLLLPFFGIAQKYKDPTLEGVRERRLRGDSVFQIPIGLDGSNNGLRTKVTYPSLPHEYDTAQIRYVIGDSSVRVWTGFQWLEVGGTTYTEGWGINIAANVIEVDSTQVVTQFDLTQINKYRFGVSGEDATATQARAMDMNGNSFSLGLASDFSVTLSGTNSYFEITGFQSSIYADDDYTQLFHGISATRKSDFRLYNDSIAIFPGGNGKLYIDSLQTAYGDTTGNKPMVWNRFSKSWRYLNSWGEAGVSEVSASNGLTESPANNIILGGNLDQTTNINVGSSFDLTFFGTRAGGSAVLSLQNIGGGSALNMSANGSSAGMNMTYTGTTSPAILATTSRNGGGVFNGRVNSSGTNNVAAGLEISKQTTGTAAAGLGIYATWIIEGDDGIDYEANRITSKWTNADAPSNHTAQWILEGRNVSAFQTQITVEGSGQVQYNQYTSNFLAGDTTNYKPLVVNSSGQIFRHAYWPAGGAGGGDVFKVGTPANNQVGVWTGDGTIEGTNDLSFDAGVLTVSGRVNTPYIQLDEIVSVTTPGSGKGFLYEKTDGKIYFKNDDGTDYDLTATGGSTALSAITAGVASNTINSGNNDQTWQWNSLGGKTGFLIEANTTAAAAGQILTHFKLHGANATSGLSTTTMFIENNHSGTTSTNTALLVSAINGTTANYAIWSDAGINHFEGVIELGTVSNDDTETKLLTWNSTSKQVEYRDVSSLAGSGTINSGTTGKPAYYVGATTLDDFIAVDYATSGTHVTITPQATTDISLKFAQITSQTAPFVEFRNSGGSLMTSITKDGYGWFPAGSSSADAQGIKIGGEGLFDLGNTLGLYGSGTGFNAFIGGAGIGFKSNTAAIDFGQQSTFSITNFIRLIPVAEGHLKIYSLGLTAATIIEGTGGEGAASSLYLTADENDDVTDRWIVSATTGNDITFTNNGTIYATLTSAGVFKLQTVAQDDTETKILVWNSTDDEVQWRDASTLGGGSSTFAALTDVNLTSLATNDFLKWDGTDWINRTPANVRADLDLEIGTDVQAFDADLSTWAGITPGTNVGTFLATPTSANLRAALTDEVGTGAAYFVGGDLGTPSAVVLTNATSIPAAELTGTIATARLTNVKQIKTIALAAPTTNDDWGFFTTQAITITGVTGVMLGTSQSVTLTLNYGDSRATADGTVVANNVFDSGDTGYQTTGFAFTLNTTSIPAGTFVWFDITAVSGTINTLELNIEYNLQ